MAVVVRKLRLEDDRSVFESGDPDLDRFFKRYAGQNQFKHYIGTTYIAVKNEQIVGFATVSAAQIEVRDPPATKQGRLPQYPLPVLRLARLAVDRHVQGRGVGLTLLKAVLMLARAMAGDFSCVGVIVDAKPQAVAFYASYGFMALDVVQGQLEDRPEPIPMFLEIGAIPVTTEAPPRERQKSGRERLPDTRCAELPTYPLPHARHDGRRHHRPMHAHQD